jgi:hypothetical protein
MKFEYPVSAAVDAPASLDSSGLFRNDASILVGLKYFRHIVTQPTRFERELFLFTQRCTGRSRQN